MVYVIFLWFTNKLSKRVENDQNRRIINVITPEAVELFYKLQFDSDKHHNFLVRFVMVYK